MDDGCLYKLRIESNKRRKDRYCSLKIIKPGSVKQLCKPPVLGEIKLILEVFYFGDRVKNIYSFARDREQKIACLFCTVFLGGK